MVLDLGRTTMLAAFATDTVLRVTQKAIKSACIISTWI